MKREKKKKRRQKRREKEKQVLPVIEFQDLQAGPYRYHYATWNTLWRYRKFLLKAFPQNFHQRALYNVDWALLTRIQRYFSEEWLLFWWWKLNVNHFMAFKEHQIGQSTLQVTNTTRSTRTSRVTRL